MKRERSGAKSRMPRLTVVLACSVPIAACSVTDYEKPISQFATAAEESETALVGLNHELTDAYGEVLARRVVAGELQPRLTGCQATSSERCRIQLVERNGTVNPALTLPPDPALQKTIVLMSSIRAYAQNLADIVAADTAARVTANVNQTIGSIESLARTIQRVRAEPGRPQVDPSEYTTPAGQAINWIVGNYVASVKLDGLRRATRDAQPVIAEAAAVLQEISDHAAIASRVAFANNVSIRNDAFAEARTKANLDKLIASAVAYDQFLLTSQSDVFVNMREAHNKLVAHIHESEPSLTAVGASIEEFATQATALARIIRSLVALRTEEER